VDGAPDPQGEGAICGIVQPTNKQRESLLQRKKSITASARLLQTTTLLPTGRYHVNFSREKSTSRNTASQSLKFSNQLLFMLSAEVSTYFNRIPRHVCGSCARSFPPADILRSDNSPQTFSPDVSSKPTDISTLEHDCIASFHEYTYI